jgi:predicted permease
MRSIVALYFVIGLVLLAVGLFASGPCPNRNTDVLNDAVFVLTWPVSLYTYVYRGTMSTDEWLHAQACEGGLGTHHMVITHPNGPAPVVVPHAQQ